MVHRFGRLVAALATAAALTGVYVPAGSAAAGLPPSTPLTQLRSGADLSAAVYVPEDLTDGGAVAPTAAPSVDLGGATSSFPVPVADLVDADVAVNSCGGNVAVPTGHMHACSGMNRAPTTIDVSITIDMCVQAVLDSTSVDCSTSGGNQSGGAIEAFSPAGTGDPHGTPSAVAQGAPGTLRSGALLGPLPVTGVTLTSLIVAGAAVAVAGLVGARTRGVAALR